MSDKTEGILLVGIDEDGKNVVVNHPDIDADKDGVGHIVFSPAQARNLARLLNEKANAIEPLPEKTMQQLIDVGFNAFGLQLFAESVAGKTDAKTFDAFSFRYKGIKDHASTGRRSRHEAPMKMEAEALERLREAESFVGSPVNELFGDNFVDNPRQKWLDSVRRILLENGIKPENLRCRWRTVDLPDEIGESKRKARPECKKQKR